MDIENDNDDIEEVTKDNINKSKRLFSFSKLNKYFFLPFICPFFSLLFFIIKDLTIKPKNIDLGFLYSVIVCLIYILGGILSFIPSLKTRNQNMVNDAFIYKVRKRGYSAKLTYKTNYLANKGKSKKVFFIFF